MNADDFFLTFLDITDLLYNGENSYGDDCSL